MHVLSLKENQVLVIQLTHNEKRGPREFNTHRDILMAREAEDKQGVTNQTSLCEQRTGQGQRGVVKSQKLQQKAGSGAES